MILRKPYAFLIKNFRLLHFILVCLMAFLSYRTYYLYTFMNRYIESIKLVTGENYVNTYFTGWMFLFTIIILIISVTLFAVMYYKKKPLVYYIYTIGLNIGTLVIYILSKSTVNKMTTMVVDSRTSRVLRDILLMLLVLQLINLFQTIIRAIGFDLKKFDFKKDLEEMEISSEDNEEFEVDFKFDNNAIKRAYNKQIRYIKYTYKEHKLIINSIALIITFLLLYDIYAKVSINVKTYNQFKYFESSDYQVKINDVYLTQYDNFNSKITDDEHTLVIVKTSVRNKTNDKRKTLNTGLTELVIGKKAFIHTNKYQQELADMGNVYNLETLSFKEEEKLLVYEIPTSIMKNKMYFKFYNDIDQLSKYKPKFVRIKLNPINLDSKNTIKTLKLTDNLEFNNEPLYQSIININLVETSTKFTLNYDYCVTEKECMKSIEYIYPALNTNYNKALVKINGTIKLDEQTSIKNIKTLYDFLKKYGLFVYTVGEDEYVSKISSQIIPTRVNTKNTIYIEANQNILNADTFKLRIKLRNKIYDYVIK